MHRTALAGLVTVLLGLSACSLGGTEPLDGPYVALGDSYTSGPGIEPMDETSTDCYRSTVNYPALVAEALNVDSTDVSCAGATSEMVLQGDATRAAQIDAVVPETDFVTIGIGGNDHQYAALLAQRCMNGTDPESSCRTFVQHELEPIVTATRPNVAEVITQVRERAPDAQVLLIGYLSLVPSQGTCEPGGAAPEVIALIARAESRFNTMLAAVAADSDVGFIDMHTLSAGHDLCSSDPWISATSNGDGSVLHPRRIGMEATADAIVAAISDADR